MNTWPRAEIAREKRCRAKASPMSDSKLHGSAQIVEIVRATSRTHNVSAQAVAAMHRRCIRQYRRACPTASPPVLRVAMRNASLTPAPRRDYSTPPRPRCEQLQYRPRQHRLRASRQRLEPTPNGSVRITTSVFLPRPSSAAVMDRLSVGAFSATRFSKSNQLE